MAQPRKDPWDLPIIEPQGMQGTVTIASTPKGDNTFKQFYFDEYATIDKKTLREIDKSFTYPRQIGKSYVNKMAEQYAKMYDQMVFGQMGTDTKFKQEYTGTWDFNTSWSYKQTKRRNDMELSKITKDIINLELTEEDQLLQKHGLKDSDNQWTDDAVEVLDQLLLEKHKQMIIEKVKAVDAKEEETK